MWKMKVACLSDTLAATYSIMILKLMITAFIAPEISKILDVEHVINQNLMALSKRENGQKTK